MTAIKFSIGLHTAAIQFVLCVSIITFVIPSGIRAEEYSKEGIEFFEKKIRPVLIEKCYSCHSAEAKPLQGSLYLDTREATRAGGDSGPAVVPKDLEASLIIDAIKFESFEMPPKGKLPDSVIKDFETWVKMGAPDPRDGKREQVAGKIDLEKGRQFWAFQPVKNPQFPKVGDSNWPLNSIDHFILAKHEASNLKPVADASRHVWLRRVTFDLVGRPPSLEEIDAFISDETENAYEKVVDDLLKSDQFGQRWGRHWLDVARYADSNGADFNLTYHNAWRYRDYVIKSFNEDKPFDQMIREQLAGDLLPYENVEQHAEQVVATGFLALGAKMLSERDKEKLRMDVIDEQLDTLGKAFLGMTLGCARCHDHKFDPIPTKDYYALAGIFRSTRTLSAKERQRFVSDWLRLPLPVPTERKAAYDKYRKEVSESGKRIKDLEKNLNSAKDSLKKAEKSLADSGEQAVEQTSEENSDPPVNQIEKQKSDIATLESKLKDEKSRLANLKKNAPPALPTAIVVKEHEKIGDYKIAIRGNHKRLGAEVSRGFLSVVDMDSPEIPAKQSGRLQLAEWIASESNPLTARVAVNRIWHHLIGKGLVTSTDNFGELGQRPTHPELLDHLASDFIKNDWSFKSTIRKIVLSRTYRLGSVSASEHLAADPENKLLTHMNRKRLDAEAIRDAMLFVSGKMHSFSGGTAVDNLSERAGPIDTESWNRRSVYLPIVRSNIVPMLEMFDFANAEMVTGDRSVTTVPSQSLILMNSPFIMSQSKYTAQALLKNEAASSEQHIDTIYLKSVCRKPEHSEVERALTFVQTFQQMAANAGKKEQTTREMAWSALCQAVMASTEFRFID